MIRGMPEWFLIWLVVLGSGVIFFAARHVRGWPFWLYVGLCGVGVIVFVLELLKITSILPF